MTVHLLHFTSSSHFTLVLSQNGRKNTKNRAEKSYERTTRIDKSDKVSCIAQQLVDSGDSYLRHRKHVENIATVLPKIRERHKGRYTEMDFSENIAIKTKSERGSRSPFFGKVIRLLFYYCATW